MVPIRDGCPLCGRTTITEDSYTHCPRCGRCRITPSAAAEIEHLSEHERTRIAIIARRSAAAGAPLLIDSTMVRELKNRVPSRSQLIEQVDDVLLYLADRAPSHWAKIEFDKEVDHTLLGFLDPRQMNDALVAAGKMSLFDVHKSKITIDGWRRIGELRRTQSDSRKAFVAMWFDDEMEAAWRDGFEKGIEDTEYFRPMRVSDVEHAGKIDDLIIAEIRTAGLVVADFTGQRGGVYFEAGFAMGLGIPVIWTCREDQIARVHFDTRQYNHVMWRDPEDLRKKLKNRILAVVPAATGG